MFFIIKQDINFKEIGALFSHVGPKAVPMAATIKVAYNNANFMGTALKHASN